MLKNEKEKFYLSIIIVLLLSGLLIWQGIINVKAIIEKNINEVKNKKVFITAYDLKEKSLPRELEAYNFSKDKIKKFNNYFVFAADNDDEEFSYFFSQLDNIAAETDNSLTIDLYQDEISSLKNKKDAGDPKNSAAKKTEDFRLLRLTLDGNFENLLKFIFRLEGMPYYVYTESININNDARAEVNRAKSGQAGNRQNLRSVLIIKVFKKFTYYEQ